VKHLSPRKGYAMTWCGWMAVKPSELTTRFQERTCDACRAAMIHRGVCPVCGTDGLTWGSLLGSFRLDCGQCQTVLMVVPAATAAKALTEMNWRP
jgi:hypothetical protein